ncbi:unnamed protein product [Thlaspi arvense]|uniref:Uncharacterized protein n=1 Tax=Thlaspi arvense TaxID=13288 RepID=A0AAU9T256_THLAR|nr:unnamed protein product [Thlaspi arvense]
MANALASMSTPPFLRRADLRFVTCSLTAIITSLAASHTSSSTTEPSKKSSRSFPFWGHKKLVDATVELGEVHESNKKRLKPERRENRDRGRSSLPDTEPDQGKLKNRGILGLKDVGTCEKNMGHLI